jgi:FkbM family methyltransferase
MPLRSANLIDYPACQPINLPLKKSIEENMKFLPSLKLTLKWLLENISPRFYWRLKIRRFAEAQHEDELKLLPPLSDSSKISVDVGAAEGIVTAGLLGCSSSVIAFEARPNQAAELQKMFASVGAPVQIESTALSNSSGSARMRMLVEDLGRSTIETENTLEDEDGSERAEIEVSLKRLDDYKLHDVGFIKIDVEGHELAVLQGAKNTLRDSQPCLLIEVEDRHRIGSVRDVTQFLQALGYCGYFLLKQCLMPIHEFSLSVHQNSDNVGGWKSGWEKRGIYINNFIFIPESQTEKKIAACNSLLE